MMSKNMQIPAVWFERKPVSSGERSRTATKISRTIRRRSRTTSSARGYFWFWLVNDPPESCSETQPRTKNLLNCPRLLRHCSEKKSYWRACGAGSKRTKLLINWSLARVAPKLHLIVAFNWNCIDYKQAQLATVLEPSPAGVHSRFFFISRLAKLFSFALWRIDCGWSN